MYIPRVGSDRVLPFTEFEEAIFHLEERTGPWNIQMEVGAEGRLDEDRLREAIRQACARHALSRARMRYWAGGHRAYEWFVPDALDLDPLTVAEYSDAQQLSELRSQLYSPAIPLDISPPIRVQVARGPDRDLVMFAVSHVVSDGVGCVRFVQSVTHAYRGEADPEDPLDLASARDVNRSLRAHGMLEVAGRALEGARRVREALDSPARIATDGRSTGEGFGFVARTLADQQTKELLARRPEGATLNDVMVAALHLTIARWNEQHGVSTNRIAVMMPINMRPPEWLFEVVGNFASFASISTHSGQREDLLTAVRVVREQTAPVYRAQRAGGLIDLVKLGRVMPLGVKRQVSWLLPLTGYRFADTVVLSNLGRLRIPPQFTEDWAPEVWFSPPCAMPLGVGVGVVTCGGSLHLVVRYRHEQFDQAAAERFTELYRSQLG